MQTRFAVLTAMGADRVGIVDDVSAALEKCGCNVEESKMAVLGGEFAVIMLISGMEKSVEELSRRAAELGGELNLHVTIKPTRPPAAQEKGVPYTIQSVSLDAPGILHAVTDLLRRHGITIEDLETETTAAPWTGAPLFRMRGHIIIPPQVSLADLRDQLTELEHRRDLDIQMEAV